MKICLVILALAFLFPCSPAALAGEEVDRVVVTVNDNPILASDVEDAVGVEALLQGKKLSDIQLSDRRAALERLIDRELLRQQMSNVYIPTEQQVDIRMAQARSLFPGAKSDQGWRDTLAAHGLDEQELKNGVQEQEQLLRFIDARLRPTVGVSRSEIETYYNEKLAPELKRKGEVVEPLSQLQPQIHELLLQQKIDSQLSAWLANLRNQATVRIADAPASAAAGTGSGAALVVGIVSP